MVANRLWLGAVEGWPGSRWAVGIAILDPELVPIEAQIDTSGAAGMDWVCVCGWVGSEGSLSAGARGSSVRPAAAGG